MLKSTVEPDVDATVESLTVPVLVEGIHVLLQSMAKQGMYVDGTAGEFFKRYQYEIIVIVAVVIIGTADSWFK